MEKHDIFKVEFFSRYPNLLYEDLENLKLKSFSNKILISGVNNIKNSVNLKVTIFVTNTFLANCVNEIIRITEGDEYDIEFYKTANIDDISISDILQ